MDNQMDTAVTGRPRSRSTFSFRSHKSDGPKPKLDLTETSEEKKKSRFSRKSKVNPNRALNEPQPAFDALEKPTLPELRTSQFRDAYGNAIADPDRTNPGRNRLERPLDTIRSFEAAIDNGHRRRSQAVRAESTEAMQGFQSRRTSMAFSSMSEIPHFAPRYAPSSFNYNPRQPTSSQLGYGQRQPPPSQLGYGSRHSSFRGNYEHGSGSVPQRRMPYRSVASPLSPPRESMDHGVYNTHAYHESHDTVNTAADSNGSQSTEPWGYSTDPSSENSSIDRIHAVKQMDGGDAYGGGYGRGSPMQTPIQEEYWQDGSFQQQDAYQRPHMSQQGPARAQRGPPPSSYLQSPGPRETQRGPPPSSYLQTPAQRNIIRLGEGSTTASQAQNNYPNYSAAMAPQMQQSAEKPDKRGSWLKRRFSKSKD